MDKGYKALFGGILPILAITACATSERALQERGLVSLDGDALAILFSRDQDLTWIDASTRGDATFTTDGNAAKSWKGGSDTGTWRIEEGSLCTTWHESRAREACFSLYRGGVGSYKQFWPDGSWRADLTISD